MALKYAPTPGSSSKPTGLKTTDAPPSATGVPRHQIYHAPTQVTFTTHIGYIMGSPVPIISSAASPSTVQELFTRLAKRWHDETDMYSLEIQKVSHPAYLRIIGLGRMVIPYILSDLSSRGGLWYLALESITGLSLNDKEDPQDIRRLKAAWLSWGRDNSYVA